MGRIVDTYNSEFGYENSSNHLYRIEVLNNQKFINDMKSLGIVCGIHYSALHLNKVYGGVGKCKNSEKKQNTTVSLPMNEKLSFYELEYIIDSVHTVI